MRFRDVSNLRTVGEWRYIQSIHEPPELRNPDDLVRHFLPPLNRWRAAWLGEKRLVGLRSQSFYYYLVARTRYYDAMFLDAIRGGVKHILNIGCGSDTRSYRFLPRLEAEGIGVLECDRPEAIRAKQWIARRRWRSRHISYLPLELNDAAWPDFELWLTRNVARATLVLIEGVSPYLDASAFGRFLELLSGKLPPGSRVAYDFKLRGVDDDFGRGGMTVNPFRLPPERQEIAGYHAKRGYSLEWLEMSDALSARLLPQLPTSGIPLFREDGLLQLEVLPR